MDALMDVAKYIFSLDWFDELFSYFREMISPHKRLENMISCQVMNHQQIMKLILVEIFVGILWDLPTALQQCVNIIKLDALVSNTKGWGISRPTIKYKLLGLLS